MPIDKMQGADNPALEAKIKEHYEAVGWDGETQSGVKVTQNQHYLQINCEPGAVVRCATSLLSGND